MKIKRLTVIKWIFLIFMVGVEILYSGTTKKLKIKSVHFQGNKIFTERRLRGVMLSRPSSFLNPYYYYPEVFKEDLKNIEKFYHYNGYLDAKVADYEVQVDTIHHHINIQINIFEGELSRVEGVSVFGNSAFSDEKLLSQIDIRVNDPFQRKKIEESTVAILKLYADNGYLDAEVQPEFRINPEAHRVLIDYNIREKVQYTIGQIHVTGLQKTHSNIALRELRFYKGEVINYSRLLESQRKLYLLGLFQSVFIRPQVSTSEDSTKKDILVDLKEKTFGEFNVAIGYESIEKLRAKAEVFNTNLQGTARKISLSSRISFIRYGLEASFTEPWTLGTPWRTDVNMIVEYLEEPGYNLKRMGGHVILGRSFYEKSSATLTYRQENAKLSNIKLSTIPKEKKPNIRSLKLSLIYDTRDNLFNTAKGLYIELSNEIAGSFLSGTNNFVRSIGRLKYFLLKSSSTVLATALEIGWVDAFGKVKEIPLNERFYTGGPHSLRGFDYQRVGPLDENNIPIGGKLSVVCNMLEIRQSLYKFIGGAIFIDIGNIWLKPKHFNLNDLRPVLGIGLRVNTPIGLARLDYGVNLNRRQNEPQAKLYFSMGQAF